MLAAEILKRQGITVLGLTFKSYFFGPRQAEKSAKRIKVALRKIDFSERHLKIVKSPRFGYGSNMNPCLDCHLLMLKTAKKIMKKEGFDFVATGEVLNERPMSQTRKSLALVEKESGLRGYLLRPLSAKLLEQTIPEKKGLVKREKLFSISGRSRKKQIELAKKWRIKEYLQPAGGCRLCEKEFSQKLRELLEKKLKTDSSDFALLKIGRHFFFDKVKIIVGRHKEDNIRLKKLVCKNDWLVEPKNFAGPTILIRNYGSGKIKEEFLEKAKELIRQYSKKAPKQKEIFKISQK